MQRRLNREELVASNPLVSIGQRRHEFVWFVYTDYELINTDGVEPYFEAPHSSDLNHYERIIEKIGFSADDTRRPVKDIVYWYEPLTETPHLFLEFARLIEAKDVSEAAVHRWINRYGLLGLHKNQPYLSTEDPDWKAFPPKEYSERGGPQETLTRFLREATIARNILTLYEAALSNEAKNLEQALKIVVGSHEANSLVTEAQLKAKELESTYTNTLVDVALSNVVRGIQQVLEAFAYPCFSYKPSSSSRLFLDNELTPKSLAPSWWPRNLLGAMYLQFFWLVATGGDLSRCRHCGRIISYAPMVPSSTGRKSRKDKEFCNSRCRQNYHYHNRTKPRKEHNGS